jgi:hypothetical protein
LITSSLKRSKTNCSSVQLLWAPQFGGNRGKRSQNLDSARDASIAAFRATDGRAPAFTSAETTSSTKELAFGGSETGFRNDLEETLRRVAVPESEVATAFKKRTSVRTRLFEESSAITGTTTASMPAKNIGAPELIPAKCLMPIPKGIPARNMSGNFIWCYLSVRYERTFRESSCPLCSARGAKQFLCRG